MSNDTGRYRGKRFLSFLVAVAALCLAFALGPPESFGSFSTALGVIYGAYLTGQSATDWQKAKNGG
jgi:hypothetical protein